MRRLLAFVLRRRGDTVLEAADGAAALALIRRARPALAILDVRMPGLDGVALTRALRADAATRTVPVLLVSAAGQSTDVAAGLAARAAAPAAKAAAYVVKPFAPAALAETVAGLLAEQGG